MLTDCGLRIAPKYYYAVLLDVGSPPESFRDAPEGARVTADTGRKPGGP